MVEQPEGSAPSLIRCEGWWEQNGFGRQPMVDLRLRFGSGRVQGSGTDIVGPFTFSGLVSPHGSVAMVKQYIGRHSVDYLGTYDGEGVMWGRWRIGPLHGPWMITIRPGTAAATAAIQEYVPTQGEDRL
jgi:hypothetical protein